MFKNNQMTWPFFLVTHTHTPKLDTVEIVYNIFLIYIFIHVFNPITFKLYG